MSARSPNLPVRPKRPRSRAPSRAGRLAHTALAFLGVACGPGAPAPVALERRGTLDEAVLERVAEAFEAARRAPGEAAAHGRLGLVYEANELWPEAARSLANAARLAPEQPLWRYHEAIALAYLGRQAEALVALQDCARDLPEAPYVWHRLGQACLEQGLADQAIAAFERTVELAPESPEGHVGLGAAYLIRGQPRAAGAPLERAVRLDPGYASAHYQLGLVYREIGQLAEAERELALGVGGRTRFLSDPFAPEVRRAAVTSVARLQRALEFLNVGKPERAASLLTELARAHPDDVAILNDLAIALQRMGRFEDARDPLEHALEVDPGAAGTWSNMAALDLDQGLTTSALEHVRQALVLAPGSARAHLMHARVLLRQGAAAPAFTALAEATRLAPADVEVLALLAETALANDDPERAEQAYQDLARLEPLAPGPRLGLAGLALQRGQRRLARLHWDGARAVAPADPEVIAFGKRLEAPRQ